MQAGARRDRPRTDHLRRVTRWTTSTPTRSNPLFTEPDDLGKNLQQLRDQQLNAIYKTMQSGRHLPLRKQFLDRYTLGREQVRKLGDGLGALLTRLPTDPLKSAIRRWTK